MSVTRRRARVIPLEQRRPAVIHRDWQARAACRDHDPEIWQPTNEMEAYRGILICRTCPVREACLEVALIRPEYYGTWGGMTAEQRDRMRRSDRRRRRW